MGIAITGWGTALPDRVVTNDDMAQYLDTSDEWISGRTGIRERRMGSTTGKLAVEAGRNALKAAGVEAEDIDLVLLATSTPDATMPQTSAWIQHELGIRGGAADINVACSGFVYGLSMAHSMVLGGMRKVLLIGADVMSKITDQQDRATAVLFGDGAGAFVLESTAGDNQLLATDLRSDGGLRDILFCETGDFIKMNGGEVYKHAVLMVVDSVKKVCAAAGVEPADIKLFVPHQANVRMITAIASRLGIAEERCAVVLDRTGNTSAASIPLALADAAEKGQIEDGELVLFCGFGAGMALATQLWRWGK